MSKRKRKSTTPNLPVETLERARMQAQQAREEAGLVSDADDEAADEEELDAAEESSAEAVVQVSRPPLESRQRREERDQRRRARRNSIASATGRPTEPMQFSKRKRDTMESGYVANLLVNPTKIVTEAQLREEYGYVLTDLRSMFILAAALLALLIVLSFVL